MGNHHKSLEDLLDEINFLKNENIVLKETLNKGQSRNEKLLLTAIFDCLKDVLILSIDTEYRYIYFNQGHFNGVKLAYNLEPKLGEKIEDYLPIESERELTIASFKRALSGENHSFIIEYGNINPAWYETIYSPIYNDANEIIGATCYGQNVTARLETEEHIKQQNIELEQLNATKDKFISIIAHDLRGPFNAFLGLTDGMADEVQNLTLPELQDIFKTLNESAHTLFNLLNNLLEWARSQRGFIPYKPTTIELKPLVESNTSFFLDQATRKHINVVNNIPDNLIVHADAHMLNSIYRNLLSNSIKFTPHGGKIILNAWLNMDNRVECSVQDSGIGMSPDMLANMFKIDVSISRVGLDNEASTGLGLILCKDFVTRHGGQMWVESEVNQGTRFWFVL